MFTFNFIKKLILFLKSTLSLNNHSRCHVEEIDLKRKIIILHFRKTGVIIKIKFEEIINDLAILSNLSAKQASWVGYYYGRHYNDLLHAKCTQSLKLPTFDFYINASTSGRFNITMLNRYGDIIYHDKKLQITKIISPINAMLSDNTIKNFDPIQACYIGILAGTASVKKASNKSLFNKSKASLKLVKN